MHFTAVEHFFKNHICEFPELIKDHPLQQTESHVSVTHLLSRAWELQLKHRI